MLWRARGSSYGSRMPLDLVLAGPGLEEQFFARATERPVGDVVVPVVSVEDLVAELERVIAGPGGVGPRT